MDRFCVLVFVGASALVVDCEPMIADGCADELELENWAVEKFAADREVYNLVFAASEGAAAAYIDRYGYELVRD